ncbi:ABC transporter ATP-binding protein [Burkholderia pseudomallei]|uniref:ABC transporter ATP-binding protein n=1 Tax=Burkholderia pseudomallei TaxID=28450 RepID=UPI00105BDFB6|nr:ABC transporter ATP-binding protein [Burkholderia pseudomallei]
MNHSNSNGPLVRFSDVQKSYDGASLIVKNLNLDIQRGEFLTLLGPSGSGKTTSLMMLAGFETPTHGEITLNGKRLDNVPPHKRNIGMVFQNYALFPHMTVSENLAFPLSVRGFGKRDIAAKVARALEMVQLGRLGGRYPRQLSGGQQQRVALARALVFEPELVLMDEPLGALDKQLREHMQLEIKRLHKQLGVTVVYVTHDQSEALTMSDRVAIFNDGVIQQIDSPSEIYERPRNAFVASFIGENNRFDGTLSESENEYLVVRFPGGPAMRVRRPIGEQSAPLPGACVQLSVRPERVQLNGASADCDNRYRGEIKEVIYLGDHVRIRVDAAGHDKVYAKQPVYRIHGGFKEGETIEVGWYADDVRVLQQ